MTTVWIIVAIFIVVALVFGAAQAFTALGDKKIGDEVGNDRDRLHTDPRERGSDERS